MMSKILKKSLCGVLAVAATVVSAATFTACETSTPEVEIQIEFNNETYTLDYTLYRELAPSTVAHFLALADNGYYDGLCVHDFDDNKLFTGGYSYSDGAENGGLVYKDYYAVVKSETFKDFPHTVWADSDKEDPLYTLYGEFDKNSFGVKNGSLLKETYGSLTMYYTEKDVDQEVLVQRADGNGEDWKRYEYNSATSLFYISLTTSDKMNNAYCTFATLDEDSVETLEALEDAIQDYIKANYGSDGTQDDFVTEVEVAVDRNDPYVGEKDNEEDYEVPNEEIRIKKVTVNKF